MPTYRRAAVLVRATSGIRQLFEEIIAFIVYQNEGREIFYFDFPDSFHAEFGIFYALDGFDVVLREDSRRTTDRTEVETTILLTSIGDLL